MLHKIAVPPRGTRDPFDYMRPEVLDAKLAALRAAGFRSVALDSLLESRAPADHTFAITFDDAYRNVWQNALPILARHQVQAIQFVVAAHLGGQNNWDMAEGEVAEDLMDVAQLRDWLAAGHSIGSHSLNHRVLKRLSEAEAREEIIGSRKRLEDTFGVAVRHFCYPSGKFSPMVHDLVREAGYQTACTVEYGVNPPAQDRFALRRISPLWATELLAKASHRLRRKLGLS